MKVVREEIFGPVVCAMPFDDAGRASPGRPTTPTTAWPPACWTRDVSQGAPAWPTRLRAGTVWVNCYHVFDAALPFGGYKQSGWGREMGPRCWTTTSRRSRWSRLSESPAAPATNEDVPCSKDDPDVAQVDLTSAALMRDAPARLAKQRRFHRRSSFWLTVPTTSELVVGQRHRAGRAIFEPSTWHLHVPLRQGGGDVEPVGTRRQFELQPVWKLG